MCGEEGALEECLNTPRHIVVGLEVVVFEVGGEVEVGPQGVVDQLVRGAMFGDDIIEF
jgi:hypothetical protein